MKLKLMVIVWVLSLFGSSIAFAQRGGGHAAAGAAANSSSHGSGVGSSQTQMGATNSERTSSSGRTPSEILSNNTKLSSNLDKLLPQGTTAQQACSGFKNLGECVAAIHVSHNLDVPFADLKSKMTGSGAVSLGKAIEGLKPSADAKAETKKAKHQAGQDLSDNS
jgi:hypothetical protein